jgi:O-antigen/teichoic acid export membrane protein
MEPQPMTVLLTRLTRGRSLTERAARVSVITFGGYVLGQVIRLASNLILTRLLYPEAFGTMGIILVVMIGLQMFSDVGLNTSIMQSRRGDDPAFLDTAWTIQVIRGGILWLVAALLAWPLALFYDLPGLALYLPVAALALIVTGFNPTRIQQAHRHLQAWRITLADLAAQAIGIVICVVLAFVLQSVWALVIAGPLSAVAGLVLYRLTLSGHPDRLRWEPAAVTELVRFGRWILISTIAGFIGLQADKIILARYIPLGDFGLYNIAWFLASFPLIMGGMVIGRVLIPVYRQSPPLASAENRLRLQRMRFAMSALLTALVVILAFSGVWLVQLLYDPRYAAAGGIVVLIAIALMPNLIILTCDQAALAAGDSRRFFVLTAARAALVVILTVAGLAHSGLIGAILGQGLANLLVYPVLAWLVRPHGAWDPLHDAVFLVLGAAIFVLAWWANADAIAALAPIGVN